MPSSKPCKSRSHSVHDLDSEYSIAYVQTQSLLSPNIPLTTPITSSMNFLLNPGWNPVAFQDPFGQSKQPTLNIISGSQVHVGNEKRVDGRQQKRPLENVTWSGLSERNPGLTLHQNIAPKGKSVRSQEPIED
ncbi:hypothetical protein O181_117979, partial [Austropuccinia psidii MF-1]|nr:hypothetical protein [Austropuccinia psidii MF-1]